MEYLIFCVENLQLNPKLYSKTNPAKARCIGFAKDNKLKDMDMTKYTIFQTHIWHGDNVEAQ